MRRGTKIALGLVAGLVGLGIIGSLLIVVMLSTAGRAMARVAGSSPERVATVAGRIAEFELPEGYVADYAAEVAGFGIAAYKPLEGRGHILVAQAPSWVAVDQSEIEEQMRRAVGDAEKLTRLRVEEVREVVVRGEPVTMTISRGASSAGHDYYQMLSVFEGKSGTACVMVVNEAEAWDQAEVDAFVASIE